MVRRIILTLLAGGALGVFAAACAPAAPAGPAASTATMVLPSVTASPAGGMVPVTPEDPPAATPTARRGQEATDPTTVDLAAGRPTLVKFFAFW